MSERSHARRVEGDPAALHAIASAWDHLDDALLRTAGNLTDALELYADRCASHDQAARSLVALPLRLAALARRWHASADGLGEQAAALAAADTGPAFTTEIDALAAILGDFRRLDTAGSPTSGPDGIISRSDLIAAAETDSAAARWLLGQPDVFDRVDVASGNVDYLDDIEHGRFFAGPGDGLISRDDIRAYAVQRWVTDTIAEVATDIDVAHRGGAPDGVLTRDDHLAYSRSVRATEEQRAAIAVALAHGAVDGEQGVADDVADVAAGVATYSGYASSALALASAGMAATGVLAPAAAVTSTVAGGLGTVALAATGVRMVAGAAAGDDEHVIGAGMSLATAAVATGVGATIRGATTPASVTLSGTADEVLEGMLAGTSGSRVASDVATRVVSEAGGRVGERAVGERR